MTQIPDPDITPRNSHRVEAPTDASNLPPVLRPENPPRRSLEDLVARIGGRVVGAPGGVEVTGITLATADLRPGEVFVALRGGTRHGAEFAAVAADTGATAIVTDAEGAGLAAAAGLPIVVVEDPSPVTASTVSCSTSPGSPTPPTTTSMTTAI